MTEDEVIKEKMLHYLESQRSPLGTITYSDVENAVNIARRPDLYREVAAEAYHIPYEEVTPVQRQEAKEAMFLLNYGFRIHIDNQILHPRSGASTDNEDSDDGVSRLERGD
jgi:hypothetical protein